MKTLFYIVVEIPIDRAETAFFRLFFDGSGFTDDRASGTAYESQAAARADILKHCTHRTAQQFSNKKIIFGILEAVFS